MFNFFRNFRIVFYPSVSETTGEYRDVVGRLFAIGRASGKIENVPNGILAECGSKYSWRTKRLKHTWSGNVVGFARNRKRRKRKKSRVRYDFDANFDSRPIFGNLSDVRRTFGMYGISSVRVSAQRPPTYTTNDWAAIRTVHSVTGRFKMS